MTKSLKDINIMIHKLCVANYNVGSLELLEGEDRLEDYDLTLKELEDSRSDRDRLTNNLELEFKKLCDENERLKNTINEMIGELESLEAEMGTCGSCRHYFG